MLRFPWLRLDESVESIASVIVVIDAKLNTTPCKKSRTIINHLRDEVLEKNI